MRPHSRAQSHGQFDRFGSSPDASAEWGTNSFSFMPQDSRRRRGSRDEDEDFETSLSMVLPQRHQGEDSDSDSGGEDEDPTLGLVLDRSARSSMVSVAPSDQLDALQRANTELVRKLQAVEQNLQHRLTDHESEIEEMENRLEEVRSELSATKREEKELRGKEVCCYIPDPEA